MSQLVASISLKKDYGLSVIDDTGLDNWTLETGTLNSLSPPNISFDPVYDPFIYYNAKVKTGVLSAPVTIAFGSHFRVRITIEAVSENAIIRVVPLLTGSARPSQCWSENQLVVPGGPVTVDFDFFTDGYGFDQFRVEVYTDFVSTTVNFSSAELLALDYAPYSTFNNGDVLNVYWNGASFDVERVDYPGGSVTPISDGPNLGIIAKEDVSNAIPTVVADTLLLSKYSYCIGLTLRQFFISTTGPSFPYASLYDTANHFSCAPELIVCDCAFTGEPDITPASGKYLSDGAITVTASSSHADIFNPIKFSLGISPLETAGKYENLTSYGTFNALAPGTYTIYAVDKVNCFQALTFTIPFLGNDYSPKYIIQYFDKLTGIQTVTTVLEKGFLGDPIYSIAGSNPFSLSKNYGTINDKFEVIRTTSATLNLISERHHQYMGLFSQSDVKYKLEWIHGANSWMGFLTPSVFNEDYSPSKNYEVSLSATDTLKGLSAEDFVDDGGNIFTGKLSLRGVVLTCLKKTKLYLNVVIAVNKYTAEMDDMLDPLGQTFIDAEAFLDEDSNPVKCDEALTIVLKPFGAFLQQKNSRWHIIEVDAQTAPYQYREFDYAGNAVGSGTIDPQQLIAAPDHSGSLTNILFSDKTPGLEMVPAYGKIIIKLNLKLKPSIFPTSLDKWFWNASSSAAYASPYSVIGTRNKALSLLNLSASSITLLSPFFTVLAFGGYIKISFKHVTTFRKYVLFTDPSSGITFNPMNLADPPWTRTAWRLLLRVGSSDYYYNENIGWHQISAKTTSTSSVATPIAHPTSKTLSVETGLTFNVGEIVKIEHDSTHYFRARVTSYDVATGALVVSSFANVGTGTFTSWTIYAAGPEYQDNYIFTTAYGKEQSFEQDVPMPTFLGNVDVQLQLQLVFKGERKNDFGGLADLHNIPSAVFPEGFRISGVDPANANYLRWYALKQGAGAESSPTRIRSTDFNSTSNAVVWESAEFDQGGGNSRYNYTNEIYSVNLSDVRVTPYPGGQAPPELQELTFVNNPDFRETLDDFEFDAGDMPIDGNTRKEFYNNIFLLVDGSTTKNWKRRLISETASIQGILMKSLGNQYSKPSWRLRGQWIGRDITFITIIKHTIQAFDFSISNPDAPNGSGWNQTGSGQSWTGSSPYCSVSFSASMPGSSRYVRQSNSVLSGTRVRIAFKLTRLGSSGSRIDQFVCVLFSGNSAVQLVTLVDGISIDGVHELAVLFNIDVDADGIGFFIRNVSGNGTCEYQVDYFSGVGVSMVRHYYINKVDRDDRNNRYSAELVQLTPAIVDSDPEIDDTGGGNTDSSQEGSGGGSQGGNAFNPGFSSGFGGGFG